MTGPAYGAALHGLESQLPSAHGDGPLSWTAALRRDEADAFPVEALAALPDTASWRWHVPRALGGEGDAFEALLAGAYAVGRRDATVALTAGLHVWSQLVWMAGDDAQCEATAASLREGGGICLAASELEHGADLGASAVVARRDGDDWCLRGRKAPIGRASHCDVALVLARTSDAPGPRALTWFRLDREALRDPACTREPAMATTGFRGADVSGLRLDDLRVPDRARLGAVGHGLEWTLRLFQITRPLVAALSLGPADTALRVATEFARGRRLYGATAADLPTVRTRLGHAWAQLTMAEILAVATVRAACLAPSVHSVASLVAKIEIPWLASRVVEAAGEVLGARFLLRDGGPWAIAQKAARDVAVVGVFDGSTAVCTHALGVQMPALLTDATEATPVPIALAGPTPPFDPSRLSLTARGVDDTESLLASLRPPAPLAAVVDEAAGAILRARAELAVCVPMLRASTGTQGPGWARATRRYARLRAAATILGAVARTPRAAWPIDPHVLRSGLGGLLGIRAWTDLDVFDALADRVDAGGPLSTVAARGAE